MLAAILVNCLLMVLSSYPGFDNFEAQSDVYFVVIFTVEALLKIVAYGFLLHRFAYLRSGWNVLDFVVVVTGILSLALQASISSSSGSSSSIPSGNLSSSGSGGSSAAQDLGAFQAFRAVRVLRPLRAISHICLLYTSPSTRDQRGSRMPSSA